MALAASSSTRPPSRRLEKGSIGSPGSYRSAQVMRARSLVFFALFSLPVLGAACAEAGELGLDDDDPGLLPVADAGDSGTTPRGDGGSATPPKGSSSSGGSSGSADDGGTTGDGGGSSSGGSSSSSSSSSSGGTAQPDVCAATAACSGATSIGDIYSDYSSTTRTKTGSNSQWLRFKTTDDGLTISPEHSYQVRFAPAAGATYEVRLHSCNGTSCDPCGSTGTLVPANRYSVFDTVWADVLGSGDHRVVAVQVKQIAGTCPSAAPWRLEVEGPAP